MDCDFWHFFAVRLSKFKRRGRGGAQRALRLKIHFSSSASSALLCVLSVKAFLTSLSASPTMVECAALFHPTVSVGFCTIQQQRPEPRPSKRRAVRSATNSARVMARL